MSLSPATGKGRGSAAPAVEKPVKRHFEPLVQRPINGQVRAWIDIPGVHGSLLALTI
jgi:hypothetical protein